MTFRWYPPGGNIPLRYWLFAGPHFNDDTRFWCRIFGLEITVR